VTWQTSLNRGVSRDPGPQVLADQDPVTNAVLDLLAAAEVSYPLAVLGVLGLVCWVAVPGVLWLAVVGTALLTVSGVGLATLPVSTGGITLLGLGAVSLVMEVLALPGFGLHAAGGGVSLALGGLYLHGPWSGAHPGIVLSLAVFAAAVTYDAGRRSWRHTRSDPFASASDLIGREAVVLHANGPRGQAVVAGELWQIRAVTGRLREGQVIRVTQPEDDWLTVQPAMAPKPPDG
jgi:membrane-bound ClpP family serine protease